jgi:hypothetical protein
LQKYLSSPNAFIGDRVFQAITTGFPIRNASGMTAFGVLQEALFYYLPGKDGFSDYIQQENNFVNALILCIRAKNER